MKSSYVDIPTKSILSLDSGNEGRPGWTITRISVLPPHRGNGIGSRLLRDCIRDADKEGVTLFLEPIPTPEAGEDFETRREQLIKWYQKHGFKPYPKEDGFVWYRKPTTHQLFAQALGYLPTLTDKHLARLAQACIDELENRKSRRARRGRA